MPPPDRTSTKSTREDPRYLFLGGATKAATTSLFFYLADHPQVCCSNIKETRFFYNQDHYPLLAKYAFIDGVENFQTYFTHCQGQPVRVEATPDYLYSSDTPLWLREALPNAKILFMLRDPVDRLASWYRFARQQDLVASTVSFEDYVNRQLQAESEGERVQIQHWRTLEQGRYAHYLEPYLEVLGADKVRVYQYDTMKQDPLTLLMRVSVFAGIDPDFYRSYSFQVHNKTQEMRSSRIHGSYQDFRQAVQLRIHDKVVLRGLMRSLRRRFEPLYLRLNAQQTEGATISVSEETKARLTAYYADDQRRLRTILESAFPEK